MDDDPDGMVTDAVEEAAACVGTLDVFPEVEPVVLVPFVRFPFFGGTEGRMSGMASRRTRSSSSCHHFMKSSST